MPVRPRAVIAGASVAGLASACALAQRGWTVTLLEQRPDLLEAGQAFLLQPNGLAALARLGVVEKVRAAGVQVEKVVFHEEGRDDGPVYDYGEIRHPHAYAVEIRPEALRRALAERAAELGVGPPRFGCAVREVVWHDGRAVGARCADGVEVTGDLLLAADGRASRTREALGIQARRRGQPSAYLLGTVDVRRATRDLHVYCGDGYANGVCPLPDGTYFWDCITAENHPAVAGRDLDAWRVTYQRRVPCADEFVGGLHAWEQLTEVEVRPFWAETRAAPGALLLGDAAGTVHPHAAQGANLALEDAAELLDAVAADARTDSDLLRSYARARQRKLRRYVIWSLLAAGVLDGRNRLWRIARRQNFRSSQISLVRRAILKGQAGLA